MSSSNPLASTLPPFGLRQYVNLQVRLIDFYSKHRAKIAPALPPDILAAMEILVGLRAAIAALNTPGPR